jgi:hypothetical protein
VGAVRRKFRRSTITTRIASDPGTVPVEGMFGLAVGEPAPVED